MCWKKTESKELSHDLVQVTLSGSNLLAAEYAGIYLKNKYNNEYKNNKWNNNIQHNRFD